MLNLENEWISIGFDEETGSLSSLYSKVGMYEFISPLTHGKGNPFGIWSDFHAPYRFDFPEGPDKHVYYSSQTLPPDPGRIANICSGPSRGVKIETADNKFVLSWRIDELDIQVTVELCGWKSRWVMKITNTGETVQSILPVFPWIDGVKLSGESGRMVALNQAGYIADLWEHEGGAYGNCNQNSSQFGCLFEEDTENALGFYIEDPSFGAKDIRYIEPSLQIAWFPNRDLASGQTITLPDTVIMPYRGSWKQTAVAYGEWFRSAGKPEPTPEWILKNDSYIGAWAEKKGDPYGPESLSTAMETFEELPIGHIKNTAETIEYAFYCSGSMAKVAPEDRIAEAMSRRHTDGWNTIRPDLGGMDALKSGVEQLHRNGKRVTLYVEGLIVPEESELFDHIPSAKDWLVMNDDGGSFGPYTKQKFHQMCAGCTEWQDHLAEMIARLIEESGVDGVRVDSLNFYFWPCYNPAHRHVSPFDYNTWVQELYAKIATKAKAVKPDVLLAVEGPSDYVNLHFNLALHQMVDRQNEHLSRDTAPLRVALPDFVVVQWNGGGVSQTLRLLPDGTGFAGDTEVAKLGARWFSVRRAVTESLSAGNAAMPNPVSSVPDMHCRWIRGKGEDIVIGVRPEEVHEMLDPVLLKTDTICATVTLPLGYPPSEFFLYDIEKQSIEPLSYAVDRRGITFNTTSNWFLAVAYREGGDQPMLLVGKDTVKRGGTLDLSVSAPTIEGHVDITVTPVGLAGVNAVQSSANRSVSISVPKRVQSGYYWITAAGKGMRDTAKVICII